MHKSDISDPESYQTAYQEKIRDLIDRLEEADLKNESGDTIFEDVYIGIVDAIAPLLQISCEKHLNNAVSSAMVDFNTNDPDEVHAQKLLNLMGKKNFMAAQDYLTKLTISRKKAVSDSQRNKAQGKRTDELDQAIRGLVTKYPNISESTLLRELKNERYQSKFYFESGYIHFRNSKKAARKISGLPQKLSRIKAEML